MPSLSNANKQRVYIALYSRENKGDERKYHWSILVSPKKETDSPDETMCYHIKNAYDEAQVRSSATRAVLTRMLGGKVLKPDTVSTTMKKVPVPQSDPNFTCRIWVSQAMQQLVKDKIIDFPGALNWAKMEKDALPYVAGKEESGRYNGTVPEVNMDKIPTFDFIVQKELVQ
ncbi:hypothetical protein RUND412_011607 [Rhizina undulata]